MPVGVPGARQSSLQFVRSASVWGVLSRTSLQVGNDKKRRERFNVQSQNLRYDTIRRLKLSGCFVSYAIRGLARNQIVLGTNRRAWARMSTTAVQRQERLQTKVQSTHLRTKQFSTSLGVRKEKERTVLRSLRLRVVLSRSSVSQFKLVTWYQLASLRAGFSAKGLSVHKYSRAGPGNDVTTTKLHNFQQVSPVIT